MADVQRDTFFGSDPGSMLPGDAGFHDPSKTSEHVQFYYNKVAEKDFCKITFPGNKQSVWNQPVRLKDQQRYPRQWRLYKEGKDQLQGQTMLETWGDVDQGSVEIYKLNHIHTVEQLAELPDANMANFGPGEAVLAVRHRDLAREFVAQKVHSAGYDQATQIAEQSQQLAAQAMEEAAALREEVARLKEAQSEGLVAEGEFPKHAGGPWYFLSDGSKVKGKAKAQEEEAKLVAA